MRQGINIPREYIREQHEKMWQMYLSGMKQKDIAHKMGWNYPTVIGIIKRKRKEKLPEP